MSSLYKRSPSEYPLWDKFNPVGGHGQWGRFQEEILTCTNQHCERFNGEVSEDEAFYLFAQQGLFKRFKSHFLPSRLKSLYVCPFCGRPDTLHPANNNIAIY